MTKREFLRNELLRGVEEKIVESGFKLTKSDMSFTRKTTYTWEKYSITFLINDDGWTIATGLLIRFNNVEDFFHQRSGFEKKYQKGTPTIGTPIESLGIEGITARFNISEENDIEPAVDILVSIFNRVALKFFDTFDNLEEIEKVVNKDVNSTFLTVPIFKGMKGLILVHFVGNKDIKKLDAEYYRYYESFSDGFYLDTYNNIRNLVFK